MSESERLLRELLDNYFYLDSAGHIAYSFKEDTAIVDIDEEFEKKLLKFKSDK